MKERLKKNIEVGEQKSFENGAGWNSPLETTYTIDSVIQWLQSLKNNGATHVKWMTETWGGDDPNILAQGYYTQTETDEEFDARMKREKQSALAEAAKRKSNQEKRDKREYERLKRKFENNGK